MRPSRPLVCFAFAATEKVDIVLRAPHLRQGPAYPGQNPKERNCKPERAVIHRRFRSEHHGVCPRARLLQAVLARAALATPASCCRRGSVDAVQREACSLPPLLLPLLPLHPLPALSPPLSFSPPKALVQVVQDEERRPGKELVPHRVFLSEMKELERIVSQTSAVWLSQRPIA